MKNVSSLISNILRSELEADSRDHQIRMHQLDHFRRKKMMREVSDWEGLDYEGNSRSIPHRTNISNFGGDIVLELHMYRHRMVAFSVVLPTARIVSKEGIGSTWR